MNNISNITIVLPVGDLVVSSIAGTYKLFNEAIHQSQKEISLTITSSQQSSNYLDGHFSVHADSHWKSLGKTGLIVVPAIKSRPTDALDPNQELCEWLVEQYQGGAHIASLCTGSFILANSDLLNNRRCTTHWAFSSEFIRLFPKSRFLHNRIITEDTRIFTSGGAYSFLNLIVFLAESIFGKEIANHLINLYQVDYLRKSQDPFIVFKSQKDHDDQHIRDAQLYIESNFEKKLNLVDIADHAHLGIRTTIRRFKQVTGNTPIEYLQRVRVEAAKELLSRSSKSISQIQFGVGYRDSKSFREVFERFVGCKPMEYRKRYSATQA